LNDEKQVWESEKYDRRPIYWREIARNTPEWPIIALNILLNGEVQFGILSVIAIVLKNSFLEHSNLENFGSPRFRSAYRDFWRSMSVHQGAFPVKYRAWRAYDVTFTMDDMPSQSCCGS
jgi:hypothetical protein